MSGRSAAALPRARYPFDAVFYDRLHAGRGGFAPVATYRVTAGTGFGFRVEAGQVFRFVLVEGPQIVDACLLNADDPDEYYSTGPQLAIEGGRITRGTRLWGSPPRSRPLATCIADTVGERPSGPAPPDHVCHSDCCSDHLWRAAGVGHGRSCYGNLCDGLAQLGLDRRRFRCNVNLFMSAAFDPVSGHLVAGRSNARPGDVVEFYAELPLNVAISLCPAGAGGETSVAGPAGAQAPGRPVVVEVAATGVDPLPWPPPAA